MMLACLDSHAIPSADFIMPDCSWCWRAEYPSLPFPEHWSSTVCAFHADWQLAKLAARRATVKTVDFVLIPTEEPAPLWFPFMPHENRAGYPRNWSKASYVLRRSVGFRCEVCGSSAGVATHHIGAAYPDGTPGNHRDKHDLRRENLICLCSEHHRLADRAQRRKRRKSKKSRQS